MASKLCRRLTRGAFALTLIAGYALTGASASAMGADLSIEMSAPATAGNLINYVLTVRNSGLAAALNVVVTDQLPADTASVTTEFVSASPQCSRTGKTVTCNLGTLAPRSSAQITIVIALGTVTTQGSEVMVLTNTASVAPTDANPSDNTATGQTSIPAAVPTCCPNPTTVQPPVPINGPPAFTG